MFIQSVDFEEKNADELFCQSLIDTGFGVLTNHPIPPAFLDEFYALWFEFFKSTTKENYLFQVDTQDGFFPLRVSETAKGYSVKDFKEYFHYYPWGQCPNSLKEITQKLYEQLSLMGATLLKWIEKNTPEAISHHFSCPLSEMIEHSEQTLLRVIHYPPLPNNMPKDAVRAAAHGDINLLTLLVSAKGDGLQVQNAKGEWMDVPCDSGAIVVNVGDMLELASLGYYRSTLHRVINPLDESAKQSRLSVPLFLHARPDIKLSEKHTAGSFLQERLRELGVKPE